VVSSSILVRGNVLTRPLEDGDYGIPFIFIKFKSSLKLLKVETTHMVIQPHRSITD
jgi:hypothetical protein